ncbi:MAG TPA: response regulator transcription factor [Acidimicrobiia bacterium]|nr:response regulator transcription factor [Acidimicrobiia bacterium]
MSATRAPNPTSVILVDRRNVVSEGVRAFLELHDALEVVAGPSEPAKAVMLDLEPDIVVADIEASADGPALIPHLHEAFPQAPVLVLTLLDDPKVVRASLAAGAGGYVLKSAQPSELIEAVETVASGGSYLQPALGMAIVRDRADDAPDANVHLKPGEVEILRMLVRGFTNSEIAAQRGVSLRTVETQRANLLRQLGVRTRAELVRYAREHGLTERGS